MLQYSSILGMDCDGHIGISHPFGTSHVFSGKNNTLSSLPLTTINPNNQSERTPILNRINSNFSNKSTFITSIHYHQNNEQVRAETGSLGFWEAGATCYTAVLIVVNCKVV